jgi:hypothetical protein
MRFTAFNGGDALSAPTALVNVDGRKLAAAPAATEHEGGQESSWAGKCRTEPIVRCAALPCTGAQLDCPRMSKK